MSLYKPRSCRGLGSIRQVRHGPRRMRSDALPCCSSRAPACRKAGQRERRRKGENRTDLEQIAGVVQGQDAEEQRMGLEGHLHQGVHREAAGILHE